MKKFQNLYKKIVKSDFSRHVVTLTSGTALAQIIPLILAPILSRIYSPEEFGRLALYLSIVQILGSIANGRYELAIVLPKKKVEGARLTILAILIAVFASILTLVIVILFSKSIGQLMGDPKLSKWLFLVPLSTLMMGVFNALNYYNTRDKHFKTIAKAKVYKSLGGNSFQLLLGLLRFTNGGLIVGQTLSHFFGNIKMAKVFVKNSEVFRTTKKKHLLELAKRYIDFPKFSMWGVFLNTSSINLTNFFISSMYGLSFVGHYSYSARYISLPVSLIGNSIGQVYFQKLSEVKDDRSVALSTFLVTLKRLLIIGLIFFVPAFFIVEEVFVILFGKEWRLAGEFASYLVPLFFVRFIFGPISLTNVVFEKQRLALICQVLILTAQLGVLFSAWYFKMDIVHLIWVQVVVLITVYILLTYILLMVVKGKI